MGANRTTPLAVDQKRAKNPALVQSILKEQNRTEQNVQLHINSGIFVVLFRAACG